MFSHSCRICKGYSWGIWMLYILIYINSLNKSTTANLRPLINFHTNRTEYLNQGHITHTSCCLLNTSASVLHVFEHHVIVITPATVCFSCYRNIQHRQQLHCHRKACFCILEVFSKLHTNSLHQCTSGPNSSRYLD